MIDYQSQIRGEAGTSSPARRFFAAVAMGIAWFFAGLVIIAVVTFVWIPSPSVSPLTSALAFLVMVGLASNFATARRKIAASVLGHLGTAISLQLPIPRYLYAAAAGESGSVRRRLLRLAALLERGDPIGVAIAHTLGELPRSMLDRIRAAEESATLRQTIPELIQRERRSAMAASDLRHSLAYVAVMFLMMQLMVGMILIFVVPKYAAIFRDFAIQLPWTTVALVNAPVIATSVLCVLLVPVLMFTLSRTTRALFISRPVPGDGVRILDALLWHMPVVGAIVRTNAAADASAVIAESLAAGRPLPDAIAGARMSGLNRVLSRRIESMHARVTSGEPIGPAACASRLPRLMVAAFAMGGGASDLAGAMGFASRAYASSTQRMLTTLRAVMPVMVTLLFGAAVAFIALALFQPLLALINSLSVQVIK